MSLSKEQALEAIKQLTVPGSHRPLVDLLQDLQLHGGGIRLVLAPAPPTREKRQSTIASLQASLRELGAQDVEVEFGPGALGRKISADDPIPGVKNVLAVMSGKGGVGKSTLAANLAVALSRQGAQVGLLDADLYGPSVPTLFNVVERPSSNGQKITPVEKLGLKLMSIGFLLEDPRAAVVWRGPMLHGALLQFFKDVDWGTLDYLLLDLPPGTGDIALSLAQHVQSTGALMVTTPQEIALQDVYKAVAMCEKVGIQILGVVENESYFVCDGCSKRHEIFGAGGGAKIAEAARAPLIGQVPLDPSVRHWSDAGIPVVQSDPHSPAATAMLQVAERLADRVFEANLESSEGLTIDRSGGVNRRLPVVR